MKTEQQKAVRQAIAMLESKSPPDPLKAAVKATQEAKKAVKKAQKIVLISTWTRFIASIRSRQSEQKKNDFRDQRRRINRWGRVVAGLWLLLARIWTDMQLSPFWKMRRKMRLALTKSHVHWSCFTLDLKEKRLEQMVAEHRKEVTRQNVRWGYFCTRMLVLEMRQGRKVSDMVLKALLRNRSTRIRKILTQTEEHEVCYLKQISLRLRRVKTKLHEQWKKMYQRITMNMLEREVAHSAEVDFFAASHALAISTLAASQLVVDNKVLADQCAICFDPRTHAFIPCGHFCVCETCYPGILASNEHLRLCPVCRVPVEDALRIF